MLGLHERRQGPAEAADHPHEGQTRSRSTSRSRSASSRARRTASSEAGNHVQDPDGRFRYQRLAEETATSVLREEMASLDSVGFYSTERRVAAETKTLELLNKQLAPMHLEAQAVLVRAVGFRGE